MSLRTYVARDLHEVLALVRREMGPDAVVLHTRSFKRPGIRGMLGQRLVEVTAADRATVERHRAARKKEVALAARQTAGAKSPLAGDSVAQLARASNQSPLPTTSTPTGDLIRKTYAAALAEIQKKKPVLTPSPSGPDQATSIPVLAPISGQADQLAREMRSVQRMVGMMMRRQNESAGPTSDLSGSLFEQYLSLLKQEVAEELAEEIVQKVKAKLSPAKMDDSEAVKSALLDAIAKLIPCDETEVTLRPTTDGRPRVVALIGPTGVGKTTTVAKLAATFKLRQNKKVALITIDTYRIAAVDQLRTYAQIIGVPLEVVSNPSEMRDALTRCAGCDVVLIDTAGRSQRDDQRLEQLQQFLSAARPHEVHLVLSSTSSQTVLLEATERFSRVQTDRIIFTKLDEAVSFGALLNVARKTNKKLSFVTTGQEVPHHIEPSRPRRLAGLLMGEGV